MSSKHPVRPNLSIIIKHVRFRFRPSENVGNGWLTICAHVRTPSYKSPLVFCMHHPDLLSSLLVSRTDGDGRT